MVLASGQIMGKKRVMEVRPLSTRVSICQQHNRKQWTERELSGNTECKVAVSFIHRCLRLQLAGVCTCDSK